MDRNVIFICFSGNETILHEESVRDAARLFRDFVTRSIAKEDDGLEVFFDEQMKPGTEWDPEVRKWLERTVVGCCLLSLDFFRSRYVTQVELPTLLRAKLTDSIVVTSLFVERLEPGQLTVRAKSESGTPYKFDFGSIDGLNSIDTPVLSKDGLNRTALANAADRLVNQAREHRLALSLRRRVLTSGKVRHVRVRVSGDLVRARTEIDCFRDGLICSGPAQTRIEIAKGFPALFPGVGPASEATWKRVIRYFGSESSGVRPNQLPLAVHVETDLPAAVIGTAKGAELDRVLLHRSGWSYAFSHPRHSRPVEARLERATCLIVTSTGSGRGDAVHAEAMARAIRSEASDFTSTIAHDLMHLRESLRAYTPDVVYIGAAVSSRDQSLELEFPGTTLSLPKLAELISVRPPILVVLNLFGVRRSDAIAAVHPLAAVVPFILMQSSPELSDAQFSVADGPIVCAARLLREALRSGRSEDPVWTATEHGHSSLAVWSCLSSLTIASKRETKSARLKRIASLLLDRSQQRAMVDDLIRDEACNQGFPAVAAIAFGADRNRVSSFGAQIQAHLDDEPPPLPAKRIQLRLEDSGKWTEKVLRDEVSAQLECEGLTIASKLDSDRPRTIERAESMVILDFGVRGARVGRPIDESEILAWSTFVRNLGPPWPNGLRVLALLSIELINRSPKFEELLHKLASRVSGHEFRLAILPELWKVPPDEIKQYLVKSTFPPDWNYDVAVDRLLAESKAGEFESLVDQIDHHESSMWAEFSSLETPSADSGAGESPAKESETY